MAHDHGSHDPGTHVQGTPQAQPPRPVGTGVTLTPKAASKLLELMGMEKKDPQAYGLRVGVIGGGCSGFQYMLDFDTKREGDFVFESSGAQIFVDGKSIMFLRGSVVDYAETLMGAGFQVQNPNVKGSCGCGSSFNV